MPRPVERPHGQWPSPLGADALAAAALRLGQPAFAPDGRALWLEGRPAEAGRTALVAAAPGNPGQTEDVVGPPHDLRSRVHEYGAGAYTVFGDEIIFTDAKLGGLYRVRPGAAPRPLTTLDRSFRFGDLVADPAHQRVLAVVEHHREGAEPENFIAAVALSSGAFEVLVRGGDFYASPTPSPDGRSLAFITWNHPHMPWDAGALWLCAVDEGGKVGEARHLAGDASASAQQPAFAPDGTLYFLYEGGAANGRWNLYRTASTGIEAVALLPAELGLPPWQLGTRTWDFLDASTAIAAAIRDGVTSLIKIDLANQTTTPVPLELAAVAQLRAHANHSGEVLLAAGLATAPGGILHLRGLLAPDLEAAPPQATMLRRSLSLALPAAYVAAARPISFPTSDGGTAHGFFYPPQNPAAIAPARARPPLVVMAHGGPTAAASTAFNPLVQFWTTRGLAVLDVNYRGSTGYGRAFRDALAGKWGLYDVDDCVAGVRHLVAEGRVDPARVAIRGSSAGGFTALAALCSADVFAAGASLYGISDLALLATDTHKFEARYLDGLVGPWPARADVYAARSPITHAARLRCPVVFFQGLDDKVVPPNQAERFASVLREKGLPVELHVFAGEEHGFRRSETVKAVYERELAFYGRVFGFSADPAAA